MKLELNSDSWKNLFECIKNSEIKPKHNFWSAIQHLEDQWEKERKWNQVTN